MGMTLKKSGTCSEFTRQLQFLFLSIGNQSITFYLDEYIHTEDLITFNALKLCLLAVDLLTHQCVVVENLTETLIPSAYYNYGLDVDKQSFSQKNTIMPCEKASTIQ